MTRLCARLCICALIASACWAATANAAAPPDKLMVQEQPAKKLQASAPMTLTTRLHSAERQGGDTCGTAMVITALPFADTGTTAGYVDDYDEACPYTGSTSPDVVYEYSPTADQLVDVFLCNSGYDTKVFVYEDTCPNGVSCKDDAYYCEELGNDYRSYLSCVLMRAGHTYYIVVDGYGGESGTYDLTVTEGACDGCPGNSLFEQPVIGTNGDWAAANADADAGYLRAESYSVTGAICDVHWWGVTGYHDGSAWSECSMNPQDFVIRFYDDAGGVPGTEMCSYSVTVAGVPNGMTYSGFTLYGWDAVLTPCCTQTDGWVSIQSVNDPDCWLLWMNSEMGEDYCVVDTGTSGWTADDIDMSVCLTGVGGDIYGACCDDSSGGCIDGVLSTDCESPKRFRADTLCADLDPLCGMGACCDPDLGICSVETEAACDALYGPGQWTAGIDCDPNPCPQPAPANDKCGDAETLCCDTTLQGTTVDATASMPPDCGNAVPTKDVWYKFIGNGRTVTIDTFGSAIDTILAIYCGPCDDLTCVMGLDVSGGQETISFCTKPLQKYYVSVSGVGGAEGAITVTMTCGAPCDCVDCPYGASIEPEACGEDTNGGCNSDPQVFTPIDCYETVCGTVWAEEDSRDTDWYSFTLTERKVITWRAVAEFPLVLYIVDPDCSTAYASGYAAPCEFGETNEAILMPAPTTRLSRWAYRAFRTTTAARIRVRATAWASPSTTWLSCSARTRRRLRRTTCARTPRCWRSRTVSPATTPGRPTTSRPTAERRTLTRACGTRSKAPATRSRSPLAASTPTLIPRSRCTVSARTSCVLVATMTIPSVPT